jgi:endonuclease III
MNMETLSTPNAVNPSAIPDKMSRSQLEWWILFTIAVAGKGAKQTEKKMRAFMDLAPSHLSPFKRVQYMVDIGRLDENLHEVRLGKYKLFDKGFRAAIKLDLNVLEAFATSDSPEIDNPTALHMLSSIPGLGPKGSRMILQYAFPQQADQWAVLDTHVLRWLREHGVDAPKSTPPEGRLYHELENTFKFMAKDRHMSTRQLDTDIWLSYSRK